MYIVTRYINVGTENIRKGKVIPVWMFQVIDLRDYIYVYLPCVFV